MMPKPQAIAQDDLMREILQSLRDEPRPLISDLARRRDAEVENALSIVEQRHEHDDFNGPTPERALIANGALQKFDLEDRNSRGTVGIVFQVATPVKKMFLLGQLAQAQVDAAERFHSSYAIATQEGRTTGRYGIEMAMAAAVGRAGGTPLSQMTGEAAFRLNHQELRANHAGYFQNACAALGDARAATWLAKFLSEEPMPGQTKPMTLADVGANFMGYSSVKSQQTAGATLIAFWLRILANHYGFRN